MIKNCPLCGQAIGNVGLYCGCTFETENREPNTRLYSVGILVVFALFTSLVFISIRSLVTPVEDGIPGLMDRHSNLFKILAAEFMMFSVVLGLRKIM